MTDSIDQAGGVNAEGKDSSAKRTTSTARAYDPTRLLRTTNQVEAVPVLTDSMRVEEVAPPQEIAEDSKAMRIVTWNIPVLKPNTFQKLAMEFVGEITNPVNQFGVNDVFIVDATNVKLGTLISIGKQMQMAFKAIGEPKLLVAGVTNNSPLSNFFKQVIRTVGANMRQIEFFDDAAEANSRANTLVQERYARLSPAPLQSASISVSNKEDNEGKLEQ